METRRRRVFETVSPMHITAEQRTARERIATELARTDFALPGTLTVRTYRCGKRVCRCHTDPAARHGPYAEWTRKINGKTVTRRLTDTELAAYQPLFDNAKRLRTLVAELQALTLEAVEATTGRASDASGATS